MKQPRKKLPDLRSEEKAREFWGAPDRDSSEYLDWNKARVARFPNVKLSTRSISLRLPEGLLERLKLEANKRDVPYQSLIKILLVDALSNITMLKGMIPKPAKPVSVEAMNRAIARGAAKRFVGSDKRPRSVARDSKRLLRDHFRGK